MIQLALALVWGMPCSSAGDLLGRVVDDRGAPVADVLVLAYDQRLSYGSSTTNAEGYYALRNLPKNPYRLRFLPSSSTNVVERYFPSGGYLCEGAVTDVKRNEDVDVGEVALPDGGIARGRLLDAVGQPVTDAEVIARPAGTASGVLNRSATTDENGEFEVLGIPLVLDGSAWRMEVDRDEAPSQFLGPVYEEDLGQVWEIAASTPVDLGEHVLLSGGALSGVVSSPTGTPDATVFAYTTGRIRSVATTGGAWEISGLTPGDATLWAEADGHANTWFPDSDRPTLGPAVVDGVLTQGVDLSMPVGAHLVGRLDVADPEGMTVTAVNDEGSVAITASVEVDGRFDVGRLAGGDYAIDIHPREDQDLLDGTLLDEHDLPQTFEVPAGGTLDVGDLVVPQGARIQGVVHDRYTGRPVYGAWVYIQDVGTDVTRLVVTESDGAYALGGLAVGTYKVWAEYQHYCDGDVDWVVRYYPDQVNPALGGSVPVAPGQVVEWDVGLAPDADHDAMDDAWEALHRLDPQRDDSSEDPDQDGFTNLEEYLFDTDPRAKAGTGCGCASEGSAWMLLGLPFAFLRRRVVKDV